MMLSEGWLNAQQTRASIIIKAASSHVFEQEKKWRKWNVMLSLHLAACTFYYCLKMYKTAGNILNARSLN
jgi:hypothetical protein